MIVESSFGPDDTVMNSFKFLQTFVEYLYKADDLIHLDICGLTFGEDQYSKLIPIIEQSKILSLHIDKDATIKFK